MEVIYRERIDKSGKYLGARIIINVGGKNFEASVSRNRRNEFELTCNFIGIAKNKIVATTPTDIQNESLYIIKTKAEKRLEEISQLIKALELGSVKKEEFHLKV